MASVELRRRAKHLRAKCIDRPIIVGAGEADPYNDAYLEPEMRGSLLAQFGLRVSKHVHVLAMLERKLGRPHEWHLQVSSDKGVEYLLKTVDLTVWPIARLLLNDHELELVDMQMPEVYPKVIHLYAPLITDHDTEGIAADAAPEHGVLVETPK